MHYHLEIIMPPTDDVEGAVSEILKPWSKNCQSEGEDDDLCYTAHSFWDWWVIGGRWSGAKLEDWLDKEKKESFYEKLTEMGITVSGLVCGKKELKPASQIEKVDDLWREWFPDSGVRQCPFFNHFNDANNMDICMFDAISPETKAGHVIVAVNKTYDGKLEAENMYQTDIWNGVTFQETTWNGKVLDAIEMHNEKMTRMSEEAQAAYTVEKDWLIVTVDYHS